MRVELRKKLAELLDATGHPWELKTGSKHIKIILAGKQIGVCSESSSTSRDHRQIQSAINRRMRELRGEANT